MDNTKLKEILKEDISKIKTTHRAIVLENSK